MKLRTIWTLRGMSLRERFSRTFREWLPMTVAARLPKRVAYWSFIITGSRAIEPEEVVPDVEYMVLLGRLDSLLNRGK